MPIPFELELNPNAIFISLAYGNWNGNKISNYCWIIKGLPGCDPRLSIT